MDRRFEHAHRMSFGELRELSVRSFIKPRVRNQAHRSLDIVEENLLAQHREEQKRVIVEEKDRRLASLVARDPLSRMG